MKHSLLPLLALATGLFMTTTSSATPAIQVLGSDFEFPNKVEGLPQRLSDIKGLQINSFTTSDGVKISYWEAGKGEPLVIVPGWSSHGAQFINVIHLLSQTRHVYVMDPRNQGLSQHVDYGNRISRYSADLREFNHHVGLKKADYLGWSMGASVLWGYIDLYGTSTIRKVIFMDEAPSIYGHNDWDETELRNAGSFTMFPEQTAEAFANGGRINTMMATVDLQERWNDHSVPAFANSEAFTAKVIKADGPALKRVMFDHITNDWRDVISTKINVPTAIFSGEWSPWLRSQRWMHTVIPGSELFVYTKQEQGDHFLALKNPIKFAHDVNGFLDK